MSAWGLFPNNKMLFLREDITGHPVTGARVTSSGAGCEEVAEIKNLIRILSSLLN